MGFHGDFFGSDAGTLFGGGAIDALTAWLANRRNQQRTDEAVGELEQGFGDPGERSAGLQANARAIFDENAFDFGGARNTSLSLLDQGRTSALDTFSQTRSDVSGSFNQGVGALQKGRLSPIEAAAQAAGFFPDEDFDQLLAGQLASIDTSSASRLRSASESGFGQALASGQTLEQAQGGLNALNFSEQQNRAGLAAGVRADVEGLRIERGNLRGQEQAQTFRETQGINSALDQAEAQLRGDEGKEFGRLGSDKAGLLANLGIEGAGINRDFGLEESQQRFNRAGGLVNMLGLSEEDFMEFLRFRAGLRTGVEDLVPFSGTAGAGALVSARNQPEPSGGGLPFSVGLNLSPDLLSS